MNAEGEKFGPLGVGYHGVGRTEIGVAECSSKCTTEPSWEPKGTASHIGIEYPSSVRMKTGRVGTDFILMSLSHV